MDGQPQVELVAVAEGHRDYVRRLSREVFEHFGPYDELLPNWMAQTWVRTVIAAAEGQAVGFVMYAPTAEFPEVELLAIAVDPGWQARGVGRKLLAHVEGVAASLAAAGTPALVRLTVAESNTVARRLFGTAGFEPVPGETGTYPRGQPSLGMFKQVEGKGR